MPSAQPLNTSGNSHPIMHTAEYDIMRAAEDRHWWYRVLHEQVMRELGSRLPAEARILDAGCGTGGMLALLKQQKPQWEILGTDLERAAVEHCQARGLGCVGQGSVCELPYESESFDAVLSLDVIYHEGVDESRAVHEMTRVLRPGGWLLLNVPAFDGLRGAHDQAVCGARRYEACKVRPLLEGHNLRPQMIHYWNAWLFLPLLAWRQWSRRLRPPQAGMITSDLAMPPRWLNAIMTLLGRVDAIACRCLGVPFGTSVFAVVGKPGGHTAQPWRQP
jgi:SAM-dependent methyltransferase